VRLDMRKKIALLCIILTLMPVIFGATTFRDTFIFFDETPGEGTPIESLTFIPGKFRADNLGLVILRMGGRLKGFSAGPKPIEKWSWLPTSIVTPLNPSPIDAIDFQGDGDLNDIAYISGLKKVTIRKGEKEKDAEILWERLFDEKIYSVAANDYDGDTEVDDLIVATEKTIYALNPGTDQDISSFSIANIPRIIASADLDDDGNKDDVVIGTWTEITGADSLPSISDAKIVGFSSTGNPMWTFTPSNTETKVIYLKAFDRDADGNDDDVIVIFAEEDELGISESDLYVISAGSEIFTKSGAVDASPADFDEDGKLDDFFLITENQLFAYNSKTPPLFLDINLSSNSDFNSSTDSRTPRKFLKVTSYSEQPEDGKDVFNDIAIFASFTGKDRTVFFVENLASEEAPTTTTAVPVTTTTTTLAPQAPSAKITGISEGDILEEETTYPLSASASEDPDGEIVSYRWSVDRVLKVSGPDKLDFTLNTFGLAADKQHTVTLEVTDNDGMNSQDSKSFSIKMGNIPPIAVAGADITVFEGGTIRLSAEESSDPDGETLSFEWSIDGTVFSTKKIEENKTFPVGVHTIMLKVEDGMGASSTDTMVVRVEKENIPPVADAGDDLIISEGAAVQFSAKASRDPDGNITSYVWMMPDGKTIKKSEFEAKFPLGTFTLLLNVTDDKGATGIDEITIVVEKTPSLVERIRTKFGTEIKITLLTIIALACSIIIFLRTRSKGFY
jgi:hypothetical protein